jgi:hypothetical protein
MKPEESLSAEITAAIMAAAKEGKIDAGSIALWQASVMTAILQSKGQARDVLMRILPSTVASRTITPVLTGPLTIDSEFANAERPGLLTIEKFLHPSELTETDPPGKWMEARFQEQTTAHVRMMTQKYLGNEIVKVWEEDMKPVRKADTLYFPDHSDIQLGHDLDSLFCDAGNFNKLPIRELSLRAKTDDPDTLLMILKGMLMDQAVKFVDAWTEKNQNTHEYTQAANALSARQVPMKPGEAIIHGFVSGIFIDLDTLHNLMKKFAGTVPPETFTDTLFDRMDEEHVRMQKKLSTFGMRQFGSFLHLIKNFYSTEQLDKVDKIFSQSSMLQLREISEDQNNGFHAIREDVCDMRFVQRNGTNVPVFDFTTQHLDPDYMNRARQPGARVSCPATPIIPEYTKLLHGYYKQGILPSVRKKYSR